MAIYSFEDKIPDIHPSAYIHPQATVIGAVKIGSECFIGAGVALRGDYGDIIIGDNTNIQENAVVHAEPGSVMNIGSRVLIGHGAIIHGLNIEDGAAIGMGAIFSHGCHMEADSMLGAGALLPPHKKLTRGMLAVGSPAREIREQDQNALFHHQAAIDIYSKLCDRYRAGLIEIPS